MKTFNASLLALALVAATGQAAAQSAATLQPLPYEGQAGFDASQAYDGQPYDGRSYDGHGSDAGHYDYARVLRVVPVHGAPGAYPSARDLRDPACTSRAEAGDFGVRGGPARNAYGRPRGGSEGGRAMASVLGSVIGAVIGSQVGGGSARYATAAIGSSVGAVAGRQVYENGQRARDARVTVCGPYPDRPAYAGSAAGPYDVTYEYGGRTYTTRTDYDPGDRIRVRVEVHAE